MKNKIVFAGVILFMFLISCDKDYSSNPIYNPVNHIHKCTKYKLMVAHDLMPYFNSFISDCEKYNVKSDHAYCLQWIKLYDSNYEQGITNLLYGTIKINDELIGDTIGMKFVVYHELGHWFGLDHKSGTMMNANYNKHEDMEWVRDNWDELVEEHFNKIKNRQ